MPSKIKLTNHSVSRGYDRLALNSDELMEISSEAFKLGYQRQKFGGKFREYLDNKKKESPLEYKDIFIRVYNDYIWIFSMEFVLITFYEIPKHYQINFKQYLKLNQILGKLED